jgi:hypothetical protein
MRDDGKDVKVRGGQSRPRVTFCGLRQGSLLAVFLAIAALAMVCAWGVGQGGPAAAAAQAGTAVSTGSAAATGSSSKASASASASGAVGSPAATSGITFVEEDEEPGPAAPKNPFAGSVGAAARKDAVPGCVELSSGEKVTGRITTTRARRLRIFNLQREIYEDVPLPAVLRIEAIVEWERVDKEWRFKEAGNPEKIYSGRAYPVRQLAWRLTLRGGHEIVGHILGQPITVEAGGPPRQFILHMRDKGPPDTELKDLVYVRRIDFEPAAGQGG